MFAGALIYGCAKDEVAEKQTQPETKSLTDKQVEQKIRIFKADVENPSMLKSGQTMTIDEAVWIIEAALNYTYCRVSEEDWFEGNNDVYKLDSISVNWIEDVSYSDVVKYYLRTKNTIELLTSEIYSDIKRPVIIDIEFENSQIFVNSIFTTIEPTLKSTSSGGLGSLSDPWYCGRKDGKCEGGSQFWDASYELTKAVQINFPTTNPTNLPPNKYYDDIEHDNVDYANGLFYVRLNNISEWYSPVPCLEVSWLQNVYYPFAANRIPVKEAEFDKTCCYVRFFYTERDDFHVKQHYYKSNYGILRSGSPTE